MKLAQLMIRLLYSLGVPSALAARILFYVFEPDVAISAALAELKRAKP